MVPGWRLPSENPKAWTQGLVAGAAFALLPLAMVVALGGFGMLVWGPLFALVLLLPVGWAMDLLWTRRMASRRLTALLGIPLFAVYLFIVAKWFSETPVDEDVAQAAFPLLGLILAAERLASHGILTWRDRALAAIVGMVATWPFTAFFSPEQTGFAVGIAWVALLGILPLRLPLSARIVAVLLAALPALALGGSLNPGLLRWGIEWGAFLAYAAASACVLVVRGQGAQPMTAVDPPPRAIL